MERYELLGTMFFCCGAADNQAVGGYGPSILMPVHRNLMAQQDMTELGFSENKKAPAKGQPEASAAEGSSRQRQGFVAGSQS